MMRQTVQHATQKIIDLLPENEQYYRLDELRSWGVPAFLVQRIRVELERNMAESMILPQTDWANIKSKAVQLAWKQFVQAIRAEARLPASYARAIIETAVVDVLDMLVEPRKNIPDVIFGGDDELDFDELSSRVEAVVVYPHFSALLPRYMQKKGLETISQERGRTLIARADEKVTANYSPLNWAQTLDPLFGLLGDDVDPSLFRLFFEDKERNKIAAVFEEMDEDLSRAEFIETLSAPELIEKPAVIPEQRHEGGEEEEQEGQNEPETGEVRYTDPKEEDEVQESTDDDSDISAEGESEDEHNFKEREYGEGESAETPESAVEELNEDEGDKESGKQENENEGPLTSTAGKETQQKSDTENKLKAEDSQAAHRSSNEKENDIPEEESTNTVHHEVEWTEPDSVDVEDDSEPEEETQSLNAVFGGMEEEPEKSPTYPFMNAMNETNTDKKESKEEDYKINPEPSESQQPEDEEDRPIWMNFVSDEDQEEWNNHQETEEVSIPGSENSSEFQQEAEEEPFANSASSNGANDSSLSDEEQLRNHMERHRKYYIKDIFNGERQTYESAIEDIAACDDWDAASTFIQNDIFEHNVVNLYSETAVDFTDRLQDFFTDNT